MRRRAGQSRRTQPGPDLSEGPARGAAGSPRQPDPPSDLASGPIRRARQEARSSCAGRAGRERKTECPSNSIELKDSLKVSLIASTRGGAWRGLGRPVALRVAWHTIRLPSRRGGAEVRVNGTCTAARRRGKAAAGRAGRSRRVKAKFRASGSGPGPVRSGRGRRAAPALAPALALSGPARPCPSQCSGRAGRACTVDAHAPPRPGGRTTSGRRCHGRCPTAGSPRGPGDGAGGSTMLDATNATSSSTAGITSRQRRSRRAGSAGLAKWALPMDGNEPHR